MHLVEVKQDLRAVRDEQAALGVDARLFQRLQLLEDRFDVHNRSCTRPCSQVGQARTRGTRSVASILTVADEVGGVRVNQAGWQHVERELLALDHNGVPRIGAAVETRDHIVAVRSGRT